VYLAIDPFFLFTDSIVYLSSPGDQYEVPTGSFLGDMVNELKGYGEDAYIGEFVAGGPKNYGYRVNNGQGEIVAEVIKVRGIRLSVQNKETVNFDSLKDLVFQFCNEGNVFVKKILEKRILCDGEHNVYSEFRSKDYRIVYTKRSLFPAFYTLPFGY